MNEETNPLSDGAKCDVRERGKVVHWQKDKRIRIKGGEREEKGGGSLRHPTSAHTRTERNRWVVVVVVVGARVAWW